MRPSVMITLLVLVLAAQCTARKKEKILKEADQQPLGHWMTKSVTFMGHSCKTEVELGFSHWTGYYQCTFSCDPWTDITGKASSPSKLVAAEECMQDFVNKAVNSNLISWTDIEKQGSWVVAVAGVTRRCESKCGSLQTQDIDDFQRDF
ncbi:anti-lipopolysaccharide factor 2 [Penaeus vannamei]|uniref:Anti-lipopolysaccharide factor 2 n=1 Tax=Penaeus vannamei TaxID=6689 RepID=A0A423TFR6_PENVA|nr:anti-lipopolysaccharide factor 2 [Penaeus vannamei]